MQIRKDPERNEINALLEFARDLTGKRVLEIGAGYGRLTWRYAAEAGEVVGIDPNPEKIARAQKEMPKALPGRVAMLATTLEEYRRAGQVRQFDVALLSWVL
jgi:2-polyprenyl-3-methyl-5-hydroxy-6-metoxy-1,4-benzoquinol methylase